MQIKGIHMIHVKGLEKRFGHKYVLRGLDFRADKGEVVALLGANGVGKSTFLRILATLSRPTAGEVKIKGFLLPGQASAVRSCLGVMTHQVFLYNDLTAEENLRFYARFYGIENPCDRIRDVFGIIGLGSRRNDLVGTYSRGMQQRLSIGRAILHNPEILLLDEPYTGLDIAGCEMLDGLISQLAQSGQTTIFSSHDLTKGEKAASRFIVLNRGLITRSSKKEDIVQEDLLEFYKDALSEKGI